MITFVRQVRRPISTAAIEARQRGPCVTDPIRHHNDPTIPEDNPDLELIAPLVRVIEEAAPDAPWTLIGAAALRLQKLEADSPNLEFITTEAAVDDLGGMLGVDSEWGSGERLPGKRLHFMRHGVPVFVFADPVFHGVYDRLAPRDIPALWDALVRVDIGGCEVRCTPLEWEFVLAVVLGMQPRIEQLHGALSDRGYDSRLVVRLLREGRCGSSTEEAVWEVLEHGN